MLAVVCGKPMGIRTGASVGAMARLKRNRPAGPSYMMEEGMAGWQGETTIISKPTKPTSPHF